MNGRRIRGGGVLALCLALTGVGGVLPAAAVGTSTATVRYLSRMSAGDVAANPHLPIVVQGKVMARDRNTPLAYTNIFVPGTGRGTMAVRDGRFWLRGLEAGKWTLKARYISYSEGSAQLELLPGDVVEVEFWLDIDPVEFDPFDVRAERKLLVVQETGTARRIGSDDIDKLAVSDVEELVALQPGVVLEDNEIHVRGGRADDTSFVVDGIGVSDPLASGRYGVSFNEDLINEIEVLTGGFSAEYGQAVSGVVNVSTKEGGSRFDGKLTWKSDDLAPEQNNYNTDQFRVTLSGPNLLWNKAPLPGEQSWIVSASTNLSDTHLPTSSLSGPLRSGVINDTFFSPRAQNEWSLLGKLTWRFGPTRKLNVTYGNQQDISLGFFLPSGGYPNDFQLLLNNYNVYTAQSILTQASWKHVLSEDSFYEIVAGRQFSRLHSNKNGSEDFGDLVGEPQRPFFQLPDGTGYFLGAFVSGDTDRWYDHYAETWTAKGDYAFLPNEYNHLKVGVQYDYSEIQLADLSGDLATPPPGFLANSQDVFFAHPQTAAAYLQDRVTYKGLTLNAGVRFDAWAPGKEVDDVMSRPEDFIFIFDRDARSYHSKTKEVFGVRWKSRLSPRLGLSFPISSRDKFFFNYGHFNQWPRWNYVYSQLQTDFTTRLRLLGNPDLDPKVTVQYETGLQHEFDALWTAGVTFYSNDIYGYAQSVRLDEIVIDPAQTPDPNDTQPTPISPIRYFNADAARSIGLELSLEKRTTRWLSGRMSLELQRSTGTNSEADRSFLTAQLEDANSGYESEEGIRLTPLLWDRPWTFTFNVDVNVPQDDRPTVFGWTVPGDWAGNVLFRAYSGARYTERFLSDDGNVVSSQDTYGKIGPWRSTLDLKLRKWWQTRGGQKLTMFLEARNVLDHENYRRVNPWTGKPYHRGNWDGDFASRRGDGWPTTDSPYYVQEYVDPSFRTDPRTILTGVSVQW